MLLGQINLSLVFTYIISAPCWGNSRCIAMGTPLRFCILKHMWNQSNGMAAASALCEFLDVVTHAVAKLNIYWLAVRQDAYPKSKLEQFLPSKLQPPCWDLPFFPDHHTEVLRSWRKPFSVRVFSPHVSNYSSIMGLKEHGYGVMPKVEQALVRPCNLSPA